MEQEIFISKEEFEYAKMILAVYKEQQKKYGDKLPQKIKKIGFFVYRKTVYKKGGFEKSWNTRNLVLCEILGSMEIIKFELISASKESKV